MEEKYSNGCLTHRVGVDWIDLAPKINMWLALLKANIKLMVHKTLGIS